MKTMAKIISYIFHPLLMLTYIFLLLLLINPYLFGGLNQTNILPLGFNIVYNTFLIPAFIVFLMKVLGFVPDLELKDKQHRIVPYVATGVFYLWIFINLKSNPEVPHAFKLFTLGATIALFMAFFINIFSKISMHTTGMGGLLGMVVICMLPGLNYSYDSFVLPFLIPFLFLCVTYSWSLFYSPELSALLV